MDFGVFSISLIILLLIIGGIHARVKQAKQFHELPDDEPVQGEVKAFDIGGKTLYTTESDFKVWKTLPNGTKQRIHKTQLDLIKKGILLKVTDDQGRDGLITRQEALRTGVLVQYVDDKGKTKIVPKKEFEKLRVA